MWETILDYWYIILIIIILCIFQYRATRNKQIGNIAIDDLKFYINMGIILIIVLLIQKWFFSEHYYLFVAMLIFVPIWVIVIYKLLSRDDVYIVESCIQGDKYYDIKNVKEITVLETNQRILIMPREIYDSKIHVGDLHYGFWAGSNRIKFTDKYDDETGIFYHPPIQQLHNFTFYAIKSFWLKLKNDLPGIIDQNTVLTLMSDWYVAFKMYAIKENVQEHLKSINNQHKDTPFVMPESLKDLFDRALKDKHNDIAESEKLKQSEPKTESPKTNEVSPNVK